MLLLYPDIVASGDHVSELVLVARAGTQVVADGLVSLPPGIPGAGQCDVFIRRGDLKHSAHAMKPHHPTAIHSQWIQCSEHAINC